MRLLAVLVCLSTLFLSSLCCSGSAISPLHIADAQLPSFSYHPFHLSYSLDGKDYFLTGNATEGINVKSFALTPNASMEVHLDSAGSDVGEIVLMLPNSMINNITSVKATAPGVSEDAQIRQAFANSTHYALQIAVPRGTQDVVIAAAHVAPEFQFAGLLAALSFASMTAVLALKRKGNANSLQ